MATKRIAGPQGEIALEDEGGGPALPVVLVHSDSGSKELWSDTVRHLAPSRRVVALDLRGHGGSAPPGDGDFSFDGRAEDIEAVADALGLDRFVIVGHSGGGGAALAMAAAHPERVAGLLLVDPVADPAAIPEEARKGALAALATPQFRKVAGDYYRSIAGPEQATLDRVLAALERTPQATILGDMTALDAFEPSHYADRYAGPVLSIVLPANDTPHALHNILGFPHLVFEEPGVGHWLHLDRPEAFHHELDSFLDAIDAGERAAGED